MHNIPHEIHHWKKHTSSLFCGFISHMLLNDTINIVINGFLFGFSNKLNFHDRPNFIRLAPAHCFFFRGPHCRHIQPGPMLFTLIFLQYHYILISNLSQVDHAIFMVRTQYILTRKYKVTPPKNRISYLVYRRSVAGRNANGGVLGRFSSFLTSCFSLRKPIVFLLLASSDSTPHPTRPHITLPPTIYNFVTKDKIKSECIIFSKVRGN